MSCVDYLVFKLLPILLFVNGNSFIFASSSYSALLSYAWPRTLLTIFGNTVKLSGSTTYTERHTYSWHMHPTVCSLVIIPLHDL